MDAIHKRHDMERKFQASMIESTAKFIASIITSTSPVTQDGFSKIIKVIEDFQIIPRAKIKAKKELPVGGFELAIGMFKGMESKPG